MNLERHTLSAEGQLHGHAFACSHVFHMPLKVINCFDFYHGEWQVLLRLHAGKSLEDTDNDTGRNPAHLHRKGQLLTLLKQWQPGELV